MSSNTQRPEIGFRRLVGKIGRFIGTSTLYLVISRIVSKLADKESSLVDVSHVAVAATVTHTQARAQNSTAFRTTINNTGLNAIWVYEDDALVMILDSIASRDMPMPARGAISLKTMQGESSATITTYTQDP